MESGKQRLDCACAVGLGFGPLVFTLWASLRALRISNVFLTSFEVPLGPQFRSPEKSGGRSASEAVPSSLEPAAGFTGYRLCRRPPKSQLGMTFAFILDALAYLGCSLQALARKAKVGYLALLLMRER